MDGDELLIEGAVLAAPAAVWRALVDERAQWWPELVLHPVAGSPVRETWIEDGEEREAVGAVTEVSPGRVLAFAWIEPGWPAPLRVRIAIEPAQDGARVGIRESGFAALTGGAALLAAHEEGWRHHLGRLRAQAGGRT